MRTLLLTGATGFVGRNFLLKELQSGTRIFAPVRNPQKLKNQLVLEGLSEPAVTAIDTNPSRWGDINPTHAVLSAGVLFARSKEEYFQTNVDWTLQLLSALPRTCRVIVLSSQSAGGPTPPQVISRNESHADTPLTWYGKSKLEMESLIQKKFADRDISILRPPMILGPRDTATLPLFKMATGLIRSKPGLREKEFSFLAVEDVVSAIQAAFEISAWGPFYIAADHSISDFDLINTAAEAAGGKGITLPVPLGLVKCMSWIVDSVPSLRQSAPSLTRDRAREIWPDRWVVDPQAFYKVSGWKSQVNLRQALFSAHESLVREGFLPSLSRTGH